MKKIDVVFTTKLKMEKILENLKKSSLFSNFTENEIKIFLNSVSAKQISFEKEEYIFSAGKNIYDIAIIVSGNVQIVKDDFWGNRAIFANFKDGDIIGEVFSLLKKENTSINAIAKNSCKLIFIKAENILCENFFCSNNMVNIKFIINLLKISLEKNIFLTQKIEHLVKPTTREKLLSYLSWQAQKCGDDTFTIPFDRQELADYLSVERSAMSKQLGILKKDKIIDFNKKSFKIFEKN